MADQVTESSPQPGKPRVLFVCTGNCCRSPLAEAVLRHVAGDKLEVFSAGVAPAGFIHDLTLEALKRINVPSDELTSKGLSELADQPVDLLITLCDFAAVALPTDFHPEATKVHVPLVDPSFQSMTTDEKQRLCDDLANQLLVLSKTIADLDLKAISQKQVQEALLETGK